MIILCYYLYLFVLYYCCMYGSCIFIANIARVIKIATFMYYISCIVYVYKCIIHCNCLYYNCVIFL